MRTNIKEAINQFKSTAKAILNLNMRAFQQIKLRLLSEAATYQLSEVKGKGNWAPWHPAARQGS